MVSSACSVGQMAVGLRWHHECESSSFYLDKLGFDVIARDWSSYWKVYRKLNSFKASQIALGSCCIFESGGRHQPDNACRSEPTYAYQVWSRRWGCQPRWITAGWSPTQGSAVTDAHCSSVCCSALPWICKSCGWCLAVHSVNVCCIALLLPLHPYGMTTVKNGDRSAQYISSPSSGLWWRTAAYWNHLFLSLEVIYREELLEGRWFIAYQ